MDYAVLGVDPGKSGGLAIFLPTSETPQAWPTAQTPSDFWRQVSEIQTLAQVPIRAMIEAVHSMPHDGGKAAFTFGKWLGYLEMALIGHAVSVETVKPQEWQNAMGCMTKGDKNITKARAQALYPTLHLTHATADAVLIATYAKRLFSKVYT